MIATKQNADVRVLIGYLCILCIWLWDSPISVKEFLSESSHLQMVFLNIMNSLWIFLKNLPNLFLLESYDILPYYAFNRAIYSFSH